MQSIHTKEVIVIFSHDPSVSVSDHLNSQFPVSLKTTSLRQRYGTITVVANISSRISMTLLHAKKNGFLTNDGLFGFESILAR